MSWRLATLGSWLVFGIGIQFVSAQDATTVSRNMGLIGAPLDPKAVNVSAGSVKSLDSEIPTSLLSKIAQTPVSECIKFVSKR